MTSRSVSLSIEGELLEKIDEERGDVSRSRFISKLLEKNLYASQGDHNRAKQRMP
jgi:metal-responsive CopG/Arc/MetJ family transcriptional regulator